MSDKKRQKLGPVRVEVTAEDIARGECGDPERCPIAKALKRMLRRRKGVEVGGFSVSIDSDPSRRDAPSHTAYLPAKAAAFVTDFDMGKPVKPFTFTLRGWS